MQPFKFITHASKVLKAMLRGGSVDLPLALALMRKWYTSNPTKVAMLHRAAARLTVARVDKNNCFHIDGLPISTQLRQESPRTRATNACRTTVRADEPRGLRQCGQEVDHANKGGFAAIFDEFLKLHSLDEVVAHVGKETGGVRDVLLEPLASEFTALHRACTSNWGQCVSLTHAAHQTETKRRRVEQTNIDVIDA